MVRAILEGRKTQTRRVVKPQPPDHSWSVLPGYKIQAHVDVTDGNIGLRFHHSVERQDAKDSLHQDENWIVCPLGKPGRRLWVKETWRLYDSTTECSCYDYCVCSRFHGTPIYKASNDDLEGPWKSPVSMPIWASRITLEITDVRVERLNDISEKDARAEGITDGGCENCGCSEPCGCPNPNPLPIDGFIDCWESIHGTGSWHENPWVWVYTFKRVEK